MIPPSNKDIVRHYLLNLLTIINAELSNIETKKEVYRKITDLIQTASAIISNEDILIGKSKKTFIQEFSLNEIIDITLVIFDKKIKDKKIKINKLKEEHSVKIDRHYFGEATKYIIDKLTEENKEISFKFNKNKKQLTIEYDNEIEIPSTKEDIIESFKNKELKKTDIYTKLAIIFFELQKIKISFKKRSITLDFHV